MDVLVIGLLIWLIVLITIPGAAKRRGRDPVGWFVLALFLGLIAPILLLLAGPTEIRRIEEEQSIRLSLQAPPSATATLKELAELRASGVLSEEEFTEKKAVLLARIG